MTPPVLQLKEVSMVYVKKAFLQKVRVEAVTKVSLELRDSEILALVGETGCGKSTLGRIALGLLRPTSGKVLHLGTDIWNGNSRKSRFIGQIVHQDSYAALNPVRTVYQTLRAPLVRYGTKHKDVDKKIRELLEFVGVTPPDYFLNKYPYHLSGGMRQRIVFARSIIPKPKFIVADEPISMIDPSLRLSILDLMMRLNEEFGTAFLYITHDLASARYLARRGRIAVMYLGEIVEMGNLQEVFEKASHPYFQALLSVAPIPDPRAARKIRPLKLKNVELPKTGELPSGCRFHTRCPYACKICTEEPPRLREVEKDHWVACHLIEEVPKWTLALER
ncbi:MAG: ABC transporter ATP-binding protein [Candidatus Freyarchaeota archaeon]